MVCTTHRWRGVDSNHRFRRNLEKILRAKREAECGAQTGTGLDDSTCRRKLDRVARYHANIEPANQLSSPWRDQDAMSRAGEMAISSMHLTDEVSRCSSRTRN